MAITLEQLDAVSPQPPPTPAKVDIVPLVIADLEKKAILGLEKYGTPLQANNGRNALIDLYQELLDACCYIRQYLKEQENEQ